MSCVARSVDHGRRQELLDAAIDYAIGSGIADLSLRPLAAELHTQAPVLLHHFGSKEALLVKVLNGVRERLRRIARDAREDDPSGELEAIWRWAADAKHDPLFRLFFEGYALALRRPDLYPGFLDTVVQDWLDDLSPPMDLATATLVVASVRGLLLDLLATGDRARVDAAVIRLASLASSRRPRASVAS
jgi:AcrR family transcriptional regulator